MLLLKLARVIAHLFVGLWTCALVFPLVDAAGRRACIRRWSVKLLLLCGVRVDITSRTDEADAARALIVANHVSWLDIFVINAWQPCRFVAKSDIRDWPLIGWLCNRAGTIFIARGSLRDVRRIYAGLVHGLEAGEHVAFFPEGTTSEQGTVLPFHANLFEAAIEARVPVQPFALRYLTVDGKAPHPAVSFVGDMTFAASMLAILKAGGMRAELIRLPMMDTEGCHRRELANAAREAVVSALGSTHVEAEQAA
jgi:1-acyl-sn-glycerol-3-phosphate acyltransferase